MNIPKEEGGRGGKRNGQRTRVKISGVANGAGGQTKLANGSLFACLVGWDWGWRKSQRNET